MLITERPDLVPLLFWRQTSKFTTVGKSVAVGVHLSSVYSTVPVVQIN